MINLLTFSLLVIYISGIWKFSKGYKQTNFSSSLANRLVLSVFWPVLLIANKGYRKNFQKALKG
ncbi:MAG: hypothetical protein QNJ54_14065 [Prochloraceae cyanobacterium]|nr:hypothetical protein [Prochloraceae cyanobacterium]